jgi:hypothetical protein
VALLLQPKPWNHITDRTIIKIERYLDKDYCVLMGGLLSTLYLSLIHAEHAEISTHSYPLRSQQGFILLQLALLI